MGGGSFEELRRCFYISWVLYAVQSNKSLSVLLSFCVALLKHWAVVGRNSASTQALAMHASEIPLL